MLTNFAQTNAHDARPKYLALETKGIQDAMNSHFEQISIKHLINHVRIVPKHANLLYIQQHSAMSIC